MARDLLRIRQAGSKSRWAVPIGAVAAVGIVIAGSLIAPLAVAPGEKLSVSYGTFGSLSVAFI